MSWTGFALLVGGLALTQLVLNRGQRQDWFDSAEIASLSLLAATSLVLFVVHSRRSRTPFLEPATRHG